jgi:hypothetical protein
MQLKLYKINYLQILAESAALFMGPRNNVFRIWFGFNLVSKNMYHTLLKKYPHTGLVCGCRATLLPNWRQKGCDLSGFRLVQVRVQRQKCEFDL